MLLGNNDKWYFSGFSIGYFIFLMICIILDIFVFEVWILLMVNVMLIKKI